MNLKLNRSYLGARARRANRGGSSKRDSIAESLEARDAARYESDAAQAEAQATAAEQRGDDKTAVAYRNAAAVARTNAQNLRPRQSSSGSPRQYTEAEIRAQAASEGKDPDAAVRWAKQNRRLKRGN